MGLVGIETKPEETGLRFVASGRLASTVIGFTGTDENGLAGLEYGFDSLLHGKTGRMRIETDNFGHSIPFGLTQIVERAVPGRTVVTTLDPYLQFETERLLRASAKQWHARSATAIVMDPWSGELLAVANVPDYDPARYGAFGPDAWRDRAIEDAYEPGSTFKLITAAAALEKGIEPRSALSGPRRARGRRAGHPQRRGRHDGGRHRPERVDRADHRLLAQRRRGRDRPGDRGQGDVPHDPRLRLRRRRPGSSCRARTPAC